MDIEHSVLPEGFKYGYKVEQTDRQLIMTFNFKDAVHIDQFTTLYDSNKHNIIVKRRDKELILCGHFYDADDSPLEKSVVGKSFILKVNKMHFDPWPVVISSEIDDGIDGKSAFLLCLLEDGQNNFAKSYEMLQKSVELGYIPAILYQATILSDPENPYTDVDVEKSLELYQTLMTKVVDPSVGIKYARLLIQNNRFEEAEQVLLQIESRSMDAKFELANLYFDKMNKPDTAYEQFSELVNKNYREAMPKLAHMLENGIGTAVDKKAADMIKRKYNDLPDNVDTSIQMSPKKGSLKTTTESVAISPSAKAALKTSADVISHTFESQPIRKELSNSTFTDIPENNFSTPKKNPEIGGSVSSEVPAFSPKKVISQGSHFDIDEQRKILEEKTKEPEWMVIAKSAAAGAGAVLAVYAIIKLIGKITERKKD